MGHGTFHVAHGARQGIGECAAADVDLVMVEAIALDDGLAELALVEGMIAEAHRIGGDATACRHAGQRRDKA